MKMLNLILVVMICCYSSCCQAAEPVQFLLCDFSGSDLCNWKAQSSDDLARWEAFSHPLISDIRDAKLPESTVESFAYLSRQMNAVYEDLQAVMTTTKIWPGSGVGCLKFQLWLKQNGDQLTVIKLRDDGGQDLLFTRNKTTEGEWLPVQIEMTTVGPYHLAFNGSTVPLLGKTFHTVAITKVQLFPFSCQTVKNRMEALLARKSDDAGKVQVRSSLNTVNQAYAGGLWPNKRIPYFINYDTTQAKSFSAAEVVRVEAAINDLNLKLPNCIKFVPVSFNKTQDFLYIIHDTSRECWSDGIGRLGGIQAVRLNSHCLNKRGHIQSILLHAIGLYNEHDRSDRDNYVNIHPENIVYWAQQYFVLPPVNSSQVQYPSPNAAVTWGLPYDVTSLTHFSEVQYSFDGARKTMVIRNAPGNRNEVVGQKEGMSIQDINKIYLLYGCDMTDRLLPNVTCYNGGTPAGYYFCLCPSINSTAVFSGLKCETAVCTRSCGKNIYNYCVPGDNPGDPNRCFCGTGYTGQYCESFTCSPACGNEGVCTGPNTCTCRDGYSGAHCEYFACSPVCKNGGTCLAQDVCSCPYGFRGPQCQFPTCFSPCQNGGTCTGLNICTCVPPFTGATCEINTLLDRKDCTGASNVTTTTPSTSSGYTGITDSGCPGDDNQYCAKLPGCSDVLPQGVCLCKRGYVMVNKTCKRRVFLGDYCDPTHDYCFGDSECIDYACQCNPYKGLVARNASAIDAFYSFCIKAIAVNIRSAECLHQTHCKEPMLCEDSRCKCPNDNYYFDPAIQTCILQGELNGPCSWDISACKALGQWGSCSGICVCSSGIPIPYWYNATEMAIGKLRYICGTSVEINVENKIGGNCSNDPFKFSQPRVCNLTLMCVTCPFTKEERCSIAVNTNVPFGVLAGSFVESTPFLVMILVTMASCFIMIPEVQPPPEPSSQQNDDDNHQYYRYTVINKHVSPDDNDDDVVEFVNKFAGLIDTATATTPASLTARRPRSSTIVELIIDSNNNNNN